MTMAGSDDIFELEDDLHESRSMPSDNIECSAARSSNLGSGADLSLSAVGLSRRNRWFDRARPCILSRATCQMVSRYS